MTTTPEPSTPLPPADSQGFHVTPRWAVEALLTRCSIVGPVLDAGCGDGAILRVLAGHGYPAVGVEISEELAKTANRTGFDVVRGDFIDKAPVELPLNPVDSVQNPPFPTAPEFIRRTLEHLPPGGRAHVLLPVSFPSSSKPKNSRSRPRIDLVRPDGGIYAIYQFAERLQFRAKGKANAEYAWFVWRKGWARGTSWQIIEEGPGHYNLPAWP